MLFFLLIRGLIPLLVFNFRVEEKFAGGKIREIPCKVDLFFIISREENFAQNPNSRI